MFFIKIDLIKTIGNRKVFRKFKVPSGFFIQVNLLLLC